MVNLYANKFFKKFKFSKIKIIDRIVKVWCTNWTVQYGVGGVWFFFFIYSYVIIMMIGNFDILNNILFINSGVLKSTTNCLIQIIDILMGCGIYSEEIYYSYFLAIGSLPWFVFGGLGFLFSTSCSYVFLSYLGLYGVFIFNFITIVVMWISFAWTFYQVLGDGVVFYVEVCQWMYLNSNYRINFSFFIDFVSISFSFLTTTIAIFVYIYTFAYFRYEPLVERLLIFLNSFILSMVLLVSAGNLIILFLGWEMIGMTSFFLINFWSSRIGTLKAAFKAYSFNKVSDVFIFFAIILLFNSLFSLDIPTILSSSHLLLQYNFNVGFFSFSFLDGVAYSFLVAAFIKSAQFGAHIWLPDSMEAPVPASALIHSATLVSAGIYLLLRFSIIFQLCYSSQLIIMCIGVITAFYGGWVSAFQSDLKRILAYSTISHCGFLMVIYTTFVPEFTVLYLYIHGFFKAAVFLSVGNVIRFNRNIQDFKRMGGYYKYLNFDSKMSLLCLMSLGGLPFTYGYYIKHYLFVGLHVLPFIYVILWSVVSIAAVTGLFYSTRLYYYTFFDVKKARKAHYFQSNRNVLNSLYYSNTSTAGNLAIVGLFVAAYVSSLFLFYVLTTSRVSAGLFIDGEVWIEQWTTIIEYSNILLNGGVVNNGVLLLAGAVIWSKWRYNRSMWYNVEWFFLCLAVVLFCVFINSCYL